MSTQITYNFKIKIFYVFNITLKKNLMSILNINKYEESQ